MKLSKNNAVIFYLFVLCLVSCSNYSAKESATSEYEVADELEIQQPGSEFKKVKIGDSADDADGENSQQPMERKLIRRGNMSIEVDDLAKAAENVRQFVKQADGYISRESENNYSYRQEKTFELRIPVKEFDETVKRVETISGKIENKNISAEDVTEQYIDVQSRLKTKRALEERYLAILKQAESVEELMQVEQKLSYVREEIEAVQGKLKYLENQTGFSTLSLTLFTKQEIKNDRNRFVESLERGWDLMQELVFGMLSIWPLLLIIPLLIWLIRRIRKRRKKV